MTDIVHTFVKKERPKRNGQINFDDISNFCKEIFPYMDSFLVFPPYEVVIKTNFDSAMYPLLFFTNTYFKRHTTSLKILKQCCLIKLPEYMSSSSMVRPGYYQVPNTQAPLRTEVHIHQ